MKSFAVIFLLIVVAVLSIFGSAASGHVIGHQNGNHGCIASRMQQATCPDEKNPFESALFHLDALKSFSTAVFETQFATALGFLFIVLVGLGFVFFPSRYFYSPTAALIQYAKKWSETIVSLKRETLNRWFALLEKRDPAFSS